VLVRCQLLHLLALLASFAITGYAAVRLLVSRPVTTMIWVLGHRHPPRLHPVPLYTLAGRSVRAVLRHRAVPLPVVPWVNYLRVPVLLSGLLLLVWFPLIFRLPSGSQLIIAPGALQSFGQRQPERPRTAPDRRMISLITYVQIS
jgi:hypothetical protein